MKRINYIRINSIGLFILTIIFMFYLEIIVLILTFLNIEIILTLNIFWIVPLFMTSIPFITFLYCMVLIKLRHIIYKDIKIGNTYYKR